MFPTCLQFWFYKCSEKPWPDQVGTKLPCKPQWDPEALVEQCASGPNRSIPVGMLQAGLPTKYSSGCFVKHGGTGTISYLSYNRLQLSVLAQEGDLSSVTFLAWRNLKSYISQLSEESHSHQANRQAGHWYPPLLLLNQYHRAEKYTRCMGTEREQEGP